MGCFGFICKGCGTSVRGNCFTGGEKCVMIHVRHGVEMGRVEGHYDEYGRVIEQDGMNEELKFRGDGTGINSHEEICRSEFGLEDSYEKIIEKRIYKGEEVTFLQYLNRALKSDLKKYDYDVKKLSCYNFLIDCPIDNDAIKAVLSRCFEIYEQYKSGEKHPELAKYCIESLIVPLCEKLCWQIYAKKYESYGYNFRRLKRVEKEVYSGVAVYHSVCYKKAIKDGTFNLIPSEQDPDQSWGKVRKKFS